MKTLHPYFGALAGTFFASSAALAQIFPPREVPPPLPYGTLHSQPYSAPGQVTVAPLPSISAAPPSPMQVPVAVTPPSAAPVQKSSVKQGKATCDNSDGRFCVPRPQDVRYVTDLQPGSIEISVRNKTLYFILESGLARKYVIAVGRKGVEMPEGDSYVYVKRECPNWHPTEEMQFRKNLPPMIPGCIPANPLGKRALYLKNMRGKDELYRIHGNNDPRSIGTQASSGCFRMDNDDVIDLYSRVNAVDDKKLGARVRVIDVPPTVTAEPGYLRIPGIPFQFR